jgi:homoserine dehydrogenase
MFETGGCSVSIDTFGGAVAPTQFKAQSSQVKTLNVALFGCGVVGTGVWQILEAKRSELVRRFKTNVVIRGICVKDSEKQRDASIPRELITSDPEKLLNDDSIDLVIELIGGRYEALDVIERSLLHRKHVITANKLVLAHELPRLRKQASRKGVNLFYSASVCGSVPVLRAIDELRIGDEITQVKGIVNGSTNFILTMMSEQGVSYEDACKEARVRGFLEADPSLDVSGQDAAQKLSVLTYHAFGKHLKPDQIEREGIEQITIRDSESARAENQVIKLIAEARLDEETGNVIAKVSPQRIDRAHLFAHTRDEFNALEVSTLHAGPQLLYGKGAGSLPTASAVISDLIELLKD